MRVLWLSVNLTINFIIMKKTILFLFIVVFSLSGCATNNSLKGQQNNDNITSANEMTKILQVDEDGNTKVDGTVLANILNQAVAGELSEEEILGIKFMLEEEKLARDVYIKLFEKWGQQNFQNISQSEGTHINAVKSLAEKYNINIDFFNDEVGEFTDSKLDDLYKNLVETGNTSLTEALKVGALIEEIDIIDLDEYMNQTENVDLELVYENLKRGSRNHLRSFVRTMSRQGVDYSPERIDKEEYDTIISTDNEQGSSGNQQGAGQNRGQGGTTGRGRNF